MKSAIVITLLILFMSNVTQSQTATPLPIPQFELSAAGNISDVAWSPDGELIAVAGDFGIKVYDLNLHQVAHFQENYEVNTVDWSPDSLSLATASFRAGRVKIWSRDSITNEFSDVKSLALNWFMVISAAWSPDGTKLAALSAINPPKYEGDLVGKIEIWDVISWTRIQILPEFGNISPTLIWSPDSSKVGGRGDCYTIQDWNCPDGFQDGVYVFNANSGEFIQWFNIDGSIPGDADWNSNGRLLVANSLLLDIYDPNLVRSASFEEITEVKLVKWHPDGNRLAFTNNGFRLKLFESSTGDSFNLTFGETTGFSWSPDGQYLVSVTSRGDIQIFEVSSLFDTEKIATITPIP